ncbi:MAG: DUF3095 family protein [Nitratireductor sp.]
MASSTSAFAGSLDTAEDFSLAFEEASFAPVPGDWFVAVSDVVGSRKAIAAGRYKAVNMAGVAMISAVMNALATRDIPFVFGGDGAALAIAPQEHDAVAEAMARTATFAAEELDLDLRLAIVPVSKIRADGFDVRVKPVRLSPAVVNFAFNGGGVSHAEKLMKAGEFHIERAAAGERPDLEGLSCRWTPVSEAGRNIVSLIVEPGHAAGPDGFAMIARELLAIGNDGHEQSNPMPKDGPGFTWPPQGLEYEARASKGTKPLAAQKRLLYMVTLIAWLLDKTGIRIGGFDPARYKKFTSLNTDFRKVQDGLRMTVSLSPTGLAQLKDRLETLRSQRQIRYGICVQESAVLTCYVPSILEDSHMHFLDGAGGGYAEAATNMRD